MADFDEDNICNAHLGKLAFSRLVRYAYHKKHVAAFSLNTPEALYNSVVAQTSKDTHKEWLQAMTNSMGRLKVHWDTEENYEEGGRANRIPNKGLPL